MFSVVLDQGMFNFREPHSQNRYKKPTRVIGNLPSLCLLARACDHSHTHQEVIGKVLHDNKWVSRSVLAGAYPNELCRVWASLVHVDLQSARAQRRARFQRVHRLLVGHA